MSDVVSVERTIPAPAEAIFAILADPRRHHEFDGSGTVRQATNVPDHLALGSEFGMNMKVVLPYAMKSRVVEYDENRRLAWQTVPAYPLAGLVAGGRIWRYELEPVEGGTLVRESWDISQERVKALVRRLEGQTRTNMTATLERLAALLATETTPA